ncbi:MAG TPA: thioredoxin family protein [Phycisphaerales bacterium]|nr:thioredoxin family protein [Phycisphaerales bacterium]
MAATESTMVPLGTPAPGFSLPDSVTGQPVGLDDFSDSRALLVAFLCNHCPFVKHVQAAFARLAADYQLKGVGVVAISSNDVEGYPEDSPEKMKLEAKAAGYTFPYLYDQTQEVARAFGAVCTPDFFLYGPDKRLVYRGQLDDSRPGNAKPATGRDLRAALDAVLAGKPVPERQHPSIGCNIKWRPGPAARNR